MAARHMLWVTVAPCARRFQKHVHTYRILPDDEDFLAVQVGTATPLAPGGMRRGVLAPYFFLQAGQGAQP